MKPPQLPAGEGSWAHEVKQALRDKLRRSCGTTAAPASRPAGEGRTTTDTAPPSRGADCRGSVAEDPIRRVMRDKILRSSWVWVQEEDLCSHERVFQKGVY
ncbi:hypothetical protein EJB05_03410, partial [Eragrostis curvula]